MLKNLQGRAADFIFAAPLTAAFVVMFAFFALRGDGFFTADNLANVALQSATLCIVGVAIGLVMIAGYVDLSVGSAMGFAGVAAGYLITQAHWSPFSASVVGIALGALSGTRERRRFLCGWARHGLRHRARRAVPGRPAKRPRDHERLVRESADRERSRARCRDRAGGRERMAVHAIGCKAPRPCAGGCGGLGCGGPRGRPEARLNKNTSATQLSVAFGLRTRLHNRRAIGP